MFLNRQSEGKKFLDVLLDLLLGSFVEILVFQNLWRVQYPRCVEAEIHTDMAVLVVSAFIELRAKASDFDGIGLQPPGGVEPFGRLRQPELPFHLELVGGVVMELFGSLSYGIFDLGVIAFLRLLVIDIDALVDG